MDIKVTITDSRIKLKILNSSDKQKNFIINKLHHYVDVYDSDRFHSVAFTKYHSWDGMTSLITDKNIDNIQIGLLSKVINFLKDTAKELNYSYSIIDNRTKNLNPDIPDEIKFDGKGKKRNLIISPNNKFSYQYDSVINAFKQKNGIINLATNAGKSAIMYSILKYSQNIFKDGQFLVIAPNVSVATQLKDNIDLYLDTCTGFIGNGKFDINKKIVVSTIQSLGLKTKKPELKMKMAKQKENQRMVSYWNQINKGNNIRQNLKLFIINFVPKYKYEEKDLENLKHIYNTVKNDQVLKVYFNKYVSDYEQSISKSDKKKLNDYNSMVSFLNNIKVVLADEIQTASSDSYSRTFEYLNNTVLRLGFTGTIPKQPEKELKIRALFGDTISEVSNEDLIEKGVSTKCFIKLLDFDYPKDLDSVVERELAIKRVPRHQQSLQRYQIAYRKGIIDNEIRNNLIAKLAKKLALKEINNKSGLGTLILVNSIEHGENIIKELDKINLTNEIGYEFIKGEDNQEDRELALDRLKNGETQILIGTTILDAGIDVPFIKNIIYVSGGKSFVQTLQRIGRALRLKDGKDKAVIFDIVDREHSLLYKHAQKRIKYYKDENFPFI